MKEYKHFKSYNNMKGKFTSTYIAKSGRPVFVFEVQGSDKELKEYQTAQGDNFRATDEGVPVFFSPNPYSVKKKGDTLDLIITTNGNVVVEDLAHTIARANKMQDFRDKAIALGSLAAEQSAIPLEAELED